MKKNVKATRMPFGYGAKIYSTIISDRTTYQSSSDRKTELGLLLLIALFINTPHQHLTCVTCAAGSLYRAQSDQSVANPRHVCIINGVLGELRLLGLSLAK